MHFVLFTLVTSKHIEFELRSAHNFISKPTFTKPLNRYHHEFHFRSPANGPYNQFDVPHEEQDIITEEERQELVPKTIQDVMKDVIVYVEVRFGDENRTASIKEAVAELGATVNDNFNKLVYWRRLQKLDSFKHSHFSFRNTTHLIFSNGTQSTYNKAKQLNIPIVSILWIEACKKQLRLVDPSKFSIHNIEQYENPELYKKVKVTNHQHAHKFVTRFQLFLFISR